MRRIYLAAVAAAVLVAGCSSSHSSSTPTTAPAAGPTTAPTTAPAAGAGVHWVKCRGTAGPSGYQCASVMVPRDPLDPSLGTIAMALDRKPASGSKIGSLLVNPGGPGASGVDALPDLVSAMPSSLTSRFDIVGFDPPGVERSAPIVCESPSALTRYFHVDPAPPTPAGFDQLVQSDVTFAAGCQATSGAELPYVSTVDAAMDMDIIRRDLGDPQLNYLGYSYGTFLGATYAELYPTHIRAMVLDGALDPALPVITGLDQQSVELEDELDQFFSACASSSSCPWQPGADPQSTFEALLARVRSHPIPVSGTDQTVGPSELLYGTAAALYDTSTWTFLQDALATLSRGNGTEMLELFNDYTGRNANGTYDNLFEANAAINCLDDPAPTIAQLQAAVPAAEAEAPIFGAQNLYSEIGCSVWKVPATGQIGAIHADGSPPIVVVGSTGDPITPYAWAQALASQLQHGVLLTRVGDGHTGYRSSSCIRAAVDSYLVSLTVPAAGTRCPSN